MSAFVKNFTWDLVLRVLPAYKTKSKDPADGVDGYLWSCQTCNGVKKWQVGTMKLVKTFVDPTCALPSLPKVATIYCADCPATSRLYCTACAGCSHRLGTKTQHHSLEAIDPTRSRNLCFLAPLFDFLVLPTILFIAILTWGLPGHYMSGRDVCPAIHFARRELYHFDSALLFLMKDKFAWACNLEDGYIRLIYDTWVRGISTDSDSMLLLASAFVRATAFHFLFLQHVIMPVLVVLNVVLDNIFYLFLLFCSDYVSQLLPVRVQNALHSLVLYLQAQTDRNCDPSNGGTRPPPTLARERPRSDYLDAYKYWKGRFSRMHEFFFHSAKDRLQLLAQYLPLAAVALRVLCITTSLGWYLRLLCGMSGIAEHKDGDVPGDALGHALDRLMQSLLARWKIVPTIVSYMPIPYATIICGVFLYCLFWYPVFKNWMDTRNWYGGHCGRAQIRDFSGKARFFPVTFEPDSERFK